MPQSRLASCRMNNKAESLSKSARPPPLPSLHYPCHLLLHRCFLLSQVFKHTGVFVIIHTVLKCQLLNHSLDVLESPYLFILTYHFSLYGSVNVQSFPFIYCIPHSRPSVYESLVLFLIRCLANCRLPLYQIET